MLNLIKPPALKRGDKMDIQIQQWHIIMCLRAEYLVYVQPFYQSLLKMLKCLIIPKHWLICIV